MKVTVVGTGYVGLVAGDGQTLVLREPFAGIHTSRNRSSTSQRAPKVGGRMKFT